MCLARGKVSIIEITREEPNNKNQDPRPKNQINKRKFKIKKGLIPEDLDLRLECAATYWFAFLV
jgi:hypothetical protein